ncbi:MAG: hypothetical protein KGS61_19360 [Verrucomicrobia bacterium]|nr:hypothetical protein [Verrucomicrobiota bacterium]
MQLLAAGHSFVGIKDAPSRYKLQENWLPRFGRAGPAVAVDAGEEARVKTGGDGFARGGSAIGVTPVAAAPAEQDSLFSRTEPVVCRDAGRVKPGKPERGAGWGGSAPNTAEAPGRRPERSSRWPVIWSPFKSRARPAPRRVPPVLESVRVVRNDLSDADLEVVPAAAVQPAGVAASGPVAAGARGLARFGWGRLASRLFQAGRGLS